MKTKSTKPLCYRVGWLAALLAAHSDYDSFSVAEDGILLAGGESAENKIPYLAIGSGIAIESGYFWDVLAIHLENSEVLRFGGVAKKQSGPLKTALNQHCNNHIRTFYQRLAPDLQQANRQSRILFSGQRYIRHAVAQQWLTIHQHLIEGIKRQDMHRFLPPKMLQCLQTIRSLLEQGYDYIIRTGL